MADVDMTDAPSGSTAPAKKAVGKTKAGTVEGADGKKRFEVKKVRYSELVKFAARWDTNESSVECGRFVGLGYRCR